jgi:hypothetical protein
MRREMDGLTKLGDTVTPEDVISAAGRVVGHGVDAKGMATILADMPPMGGQGLAGWLMMHDQAITQQEAHAETLQAILQHRMGQAALRAIAGLHVADGARKAAVTAGALAPGRRPIGPLSPRPTAGPAGMAPQGAPQGQPQQGAEGAAPGEETE